MLNFDTTQQESDLILQIAERAKGLPWPDHPSMMNLLMDVTGAHCNGCPLDLERLLAADDFNFAHDIGGIRRHINRETGKLMDCFVPRFALSAPASIDPAAELTRAIFGG